MDSDYYIERIGIVDGLEGKRKKERVVHLETKIRFETDIESDNTWSDELVKDVIRLSLPPGVAVNPGDLVHMTLRFTNPRGQRFAPALEMGEETVGSDGEVRKAIPNDDLYACQVSGCGSSAIWNYPDRNYPDNVYFCDTHDQSQWQTDADGELVTESSDA